MDIKTVKKEKQKLEADITTAISVLVADFSKKTDSFPQSIYIDMINIDTFSNQKKEYIVGQCKVTIEI